MKPLTRAILAGNRPAFAVPAYTDTSGDYPESHKPQEGMTLRVWLTGQALAGLCASGEAIDYATSTADAAVEIADKALSALFPEAVAAQPGEIWGDYSGTFFIITSTGRGTVIETEDHPDDPDGVKVGSHHHRHITTDWAYQVTGPEAERLAALVERAAPGQVWFVRGTGDVVAINEDLRGFVLNPKPKEEWRRWVDDMEISLLNSAKVAGSMRVYLADHPDRIAPGQRRYEEMRVHFPEKPAWADAPEPQRNYYAFLDGFTLPGYCPPAPEDQPDQTPPTDTP